MKILHFISGLHPGGKERQLVELLRFLSKQEGVEVHVAVMSHEIKYPEVLELGIPIHYLIRRFKQDPRIFLRFFSLCREIRPSVVHTWDSMTSVYAAPVCRALGIRFMNNMIQDAPPRLPMFSRMWLCSRLTFPLSDMVVGNSKAGMKSYGVAHRESYCVYNGFDNTRFERIGDPEMVRREFSITTDYVVGMVGEFAERKDFETFLLAGQEILRTRNDVTFVTVGDGETLDYCKSLVPPMYRERILFLGWQSNVERIVNIMDIGVLATFTEGISNSILEYMALGKPVVATDGGGTSEIVLDGQTGFLVACRNVEQLAGRIRELLDDPGEAKRMGRGGKQFVAETFQIETMGKRFLDLYSRLLAKT